MADTETEGVLIWPENRWLVALELIAWYAVIVVLLWIVL